MTQIQAQVLHKTLEARKLIQKQKTDEEFDALTEKSRQSANNILLQKLLYQNRLHKDAGPKQDINVQLHTLFRLEYAQKALTMGITEEYVQRLFQLSLEEMRTLKKTAACF